jgi:mercuric ion transport protein
MAAQTQLSAVLARRATAERGKAAGAMLLTAAGVVAALGAASCCLAPFALFMVGIGGAWIANLAGLAAYHSLLLAVSLACLAGGITLLRWRSRTAAVSCAAGTSCATPASYRAVRVGLWLASAIIVAELAFPHLTFLFPDQPR